MDRNVLMTLFYEASIHPNTYVYIREHLHLCQGYRRKCCLLGWPCVGPGDLISGEPTWSRVARKPKIEVFMIQPTSYEEA